MSGTATALVLALIALVLGEQVGAYRDDLADRDGDRTEYADRGSTGTTAPDPAQSSRLVQNSDSPDAANAISSPLPTNQVVISRRSVV